MESRELSESMNNLEKDLNLTNEPVAEAAGAVDVNENENISETNEVVEQHVEVGTGSKT